MSTCPKSKHDFFASSVLLSSQRCRPVRTFRSSRERPTMRSFWSCARGPTRSRPSGRPLLTATLPCAQGNCSVLQRCHVESGAIFCGPCASFFSRAAISTHSSILVHGTLLNPPPLFRFPSFARRGHCAGSAPEPFSHGPYGLSPSPARSLANSRRFLNAYWEQLEPHAEQLWAYVHKCNDLDSEHHELGTGLDEVSGPGPLLLCS